MATMHMANFHDNIFLHKISGSRFEQAYCALTFVRYVIGILFYMVARRIATTTTTTIIPTTTTTTITTATTTTTNDKNRYY